MHPEAPPDFVQGSWSPHAGALDPAKVHPGLLCELQGLESPLPELVWDVVVEYVQPLSMLKDTLVAWGQSPGTGQAQEEVLSVAGDAALLLDPELWCEDFRAPKNPPMPAIACPSLPCDVAGKLFLGDFRRGASCHYPGAALASLRPPLPGQRSPRGSQTTGGLARGILRCNWHRSPALSIQSGLHPAFARRCGMPEPCPDLA